MHLRPDIPNGHMKNSAITAEVLYVVTRQEIARGADWFIGAMDYAAFRRAGYTFAMRYAVPGIDGKMISAAEIHRAHAEGISIGLIYETTGLTWTGGKTQGRIDGLAAKDALISLSAPDIVACYFAIDSNVTYAEMGTVIDYLDAADSAIEPYQMGVYGQFSVIEEVYSKIPHAVLWQTAAWSNGLVSLEADIFQDSQTTLLGVDIDTDSLFDEDAGLWHPPTMPVPQPQPKGLPDMFLVHVTGSPDVYLYNGQMHHVTSPTNEVEFAKILPTITIDEGQFEVLAGGSKA